MPILTSRDDEETDHAHDHQQRRGHASSEAAGAEVHTRGAAAATSTGGGAAAGLAPTAGALAPTATGAASAIAPRVNVLSPSQGAHYPAGLVPATFEIFGAPGSTVILYVTVYRRGKVYQDGHVSVTLGPSGEATYTSYTPVDNNEHYGMHARVQTQAGVMSPLRVVEFHGEQVIETKGGGV
jgi:hypothetical protein